jgi:hypothetical protein
MQALKKAMKKALIVPAISALLATAAGAAGEVVDPERAGRYFEEAQEISRKDNSRLWGMPLYGPLILVDPQTHAAVANQADAEGQLVKSGKVFVGKLPPELNVANTATDWAGVHWTMIIWPLPEDPQARARLMIHECFHRIQDKLGLKATNPANAHLESRDGRIWLQLEWRALEAALEENGAPRKQALEDALFFRSYRQSLFPKAGEEERDLELNEGLAEYTGVKLSTRSIFEMAAVAVCALRQGRGRSSLARSFAYVSGPAYGALLDLSGADWRARLKTDADFVGLIGKAYALGPATASRGQALERAHAYQGDYVVAAETERENIRRERVAKDRAKFIESPVLILPVGKTFGYSFDPNQVVPLDDLHTVYLNARVTDDWGTLEAPGGVLIVREGGRVVRLQVPVPGDPKARPLKGDGWTLEPEKGRRVAPGSRAGDYTLERESESH